MSTLWSGRFDTAPDAAAFEWGSSFSFDRRLFEDDVTGSIAWARALGAAGVLGTDEGRDIEAALRDILERGRSNPAFVAGADEDVHSFVERLLVERLGDAGRRLHTGRSRNEQVSLDLRLYLRRRIPALQQAVGRAVASLVAQARGAGDALMPAFTHFRPAQPVLVAHFFMAHVAPLRRDHGRLAAALAEADALPLGSGAIAGTAYAVDVEAIARDLNFSRIVANSIDASSDRDFAATFLYACSLTLVHLSRLAEDLIILCGDGHGFFELSDALSTGSSMMPQKKNPDPLDSVTSLVPSIPTLTASTPMSSITARTWAVTMSAGSGWITETPTVFCAVIAVIAVIPCTPQRAKAFRSACTPAPPPESEPAMLSAVRVRTGP